MFVAPFRWSGTLLFWEQDIIVDGPAGQPFGEDTHKDLVDTGHQGDGAEVGGIVGGAFLVDHNGGRAFPQSRYVTLGHTVLEDERQDLTGWVDRFKMPVFDAVWARRGVSAGTDLRTNLVCSRGLKKALVCRAGGYVVD